MNLKKFLNLKLIFIYFIIKINNNNFFKFKTTKNNNAYDRTRICN